MRSAAKNTIEHDEAEATEFLPVIRDQRGAQISAPDRGEIDSTSADLIYGYAPRYAPAQHDGYLGQVIGREQISRLMGPEPLPTPRALVKVHNFIRHVGASPITPAIGVIAMAGLAAWIHSEPYHPLWGGVIISVGGYLIHSGITAHRRHGEDADPAFTKGAVAAGVGAAFIGTGVTTGISPWLYLATAVAGIATYSARAAILSGRLERARQFAVGIVAAGNSGPALPYAPQPTPWSGPVSDEEYRVRKAFTGIKAEQVILGATRRVTDDVWYVFADLSDTPLTAEQVERNAEKLATAMSARLVEVERGARPALVKVTVYDGEDLLAEPIPAGADGVESVLDPITLGPYEDGSSAAISLGWKHTLVCGTTDMGKSGVLNLILCKTMPAQNLTRILIDCKEGAPEFRAYKDVAFHVATELDDAMRTLAGIEGIYRYRGRLLVEKDVIPERDDETGETVQKWRPEYGPFILCSIDELTELTKKVKGAADRIQSLRAVMRFVGMFALDATQFPARDTFGGTTTARMNYLNRISLGIAEQGGTNIIFGQGMHGRGWRPDLLDLPGKFLMSTPTNKRPRKARAEWFESVDVARTVAAWRGRVPDLDEGSVEGFWEAYHAEPAVEITGGGGGPRGGQPQPVIDAPVGPFRPRLVVVPQYPDGDDMDEKDVQLWQLLGEYGRDGARAKDLSTRAQVLGHKYTSEPWVRGRLRYWSAKGYAGEREDGRETVFWRTDLRVDERKDA
jgi:hypothetical protein